ncbi:MAG TPA: PH domain-containing protein [Acidimicrobiales bacterium]|nr:PH domain-containing protein [Acidimicrobiales bacterium]
MRADGYLLPAERKVVAVRRHPAMMGRRALAAFAAVLVAAAVHDHLPPRDPLATVVWIAALAVVARLVWRALEWNSERFVVTDQRVMLITGLTTRRVAMLPLRKVTDMTYKRSPTGRLFGFGEFVMESAGNSQGLRRVEYVPEPDRIYLAVSRLVFGEDAVTDRPGDEL